MRILTSVNDMRSQRESRCGRGDRGSFPVGLYCVGGDIIHTPLSESKVLTKRTLYVQVPCGETLSLSVFVTWLIP